MAKKKDYLAEKRTHFAEKRTELAHERTIMAYIRTSANITLFGVAFIGFSPERGSFFYYAGVSSLAVGLLFLAIAVARGFKHSREIQNIKSFFHKFEKMMGFVKK